MQSSVSFRKPAQECGWAYFPKEYTSALASGDVFAASPAVGYLRPRSLRIQVVAYPLERFFVLLMLGIADGFQQIAGAGQISSRKGEPGALFPSARRWPCKKSQSPMAVSVGVHFVIAMECEAAFRACRPLHGCIGLVFSPRKFSRTSLASPT
jgi:hypothetical protein